MVMFRSTSTHSLSHIHTRMHARTHTHTSFMASIMIGEMMGTRTLDNTRRALALMSWFGSFSPFWKVLIERRARSCCSSA